MTKRSLRARLGTRLQMERIEIEISKNLQMLKRERTLYRRYCFKYKMKFACKALMAINRNITTRKKQLKKHQQLMDKYKQRGLI